MARVMPPLHQELQTRIATAVSLAEIGEVAKAEARRGSETWRNLKPPRLEALYEMAYLRVFLAWESYLADAFWRYLCGYTSQFGQATRIGNAAFLASVEKAERAVLGTQDYVLWHNPDHIIKRTNKFFSSSTIGATVASFKADLSHMAAIRHRIAHSQSDARSKFDAATKALAGRRYRGSSAGAFLRDWVSGASTPTRWLSRLASDITSVAAQIS
jgi:hypothetical protein